MSRNEISPFDMECVRAYAECDMSVTGAAKKLYTCDTNVVYHLEKVRRITGRNPRRFHDLVALLGVKA